MLSTATLRIALTATVYVGIGLPILVACPTQRPTACQKDAPRRFRVAIAGLFDFDSDGESDIEVLRRVIALNGGVIDAELDIDGQSRGQLRPDTAYLIIGQVPDETRASPKVIQQFDDFMQRATQLKVRILEADRLLARGSPRTITDETASSRFRRRRRPPAPGPMRQ